MGSFLGKMKVRWQLMFYDVLLFLVVFAFIFTTYGINKEKKEEIILFLVSLHFELQFVPKFFLRFFYDHFVLQVAMKIDLLFCRHKRENFPT